MAVVPDDIRLPWAGLGAAVLVQIAAGNSYTFPLYSPSLKSILGLNQHYVTLLGFANDIGESMVIITDPVNSWSPRTHLLVGALLSFFGYGIFWLAVSQTFPSIPYLILFISLFAATNSSAWLSTGVLDANKQSFPNNQSTVATILEAYIGLSSSVLTEVYSILLKRSASSLLLLLTFGVPFICLLTMYLVRPYNSAPIERPLEDNNLCSIQIASIALAGYLLVTTILSEICSLGQIFSYIIIAIMFLLLIAPFAIPLKMTVLPHQNEENPPENVNEDNGIDPAAPLIASSSSESTSESSNEQEVIDVDEGAVGENLTASEAAWRLDFWLLGLVYFIGVGSGVTVLNNLSQIAVSLGFHNTTVLVSLFTFCNFIGCLGAEKVSEYCMRWKSVPRTTWMAVTQCIMSLTFIFYASTQGATFYGATAILGICYGTQFGIMTSTASEIFGLRSIQRITNIIQLGNPVGALLFSVMLAAHVYDSEAAKQNKSSCLGPQCFQFTFYVLCGACLFGSALAIILTKRIKPVYRALGGGLPHNE